MADNLEVSTSDQQNPHPTNLQPPKNSCRLEASYDPTPSNDQKYLQIYHWPLPTCHSFRLRFAGRLATAMRRSPRAAGSGVQAVRRKQTPSRPWGGTAYKNETISTTDSTAIVCHVHHLTRYFFRFKRRALQFHFAQLHGWQTGWNEAPGMLCHQVFRP